MRIIGSSKLHVCGGNTTRRVEDKRGSLSRGTYKSHSAGEALKINRLPLSTRDFSCSSNYDSDSAHCLFSFYKIWSVNFVYFPYTWARILRNGGLRLTILPYEFLWGPELFNNMHKASPPKDLSFVLSLVHGKSCWINFGWTFTCYYK